MRSLAQLLSEMNESGEVQKLIDDEAKRKKTTRLRELIAQISINYGGDDLEILEEYIEDVLNNYANNLDKAIACFEDVAKQNNN